MTKIKTNSFLDEIVSIEDVGEIDTYDFTIPITHCFFANGVLVHNSGSVEEKCDCCLMLHYPYFYDKSENINELQVIVAKNRYGKTGHAKLFVHPEYSKISDDGNVHKHEKVILNVAGSDGERCGESNTHSEVVQSAISPSEINWEE